MATRVLDRIPVQQVHERAEQIQMARVAAAIPTGLLVVLGWLAGMLVSILGVGLRWTLAALAVGWESARQATEAWRPVKGSGG